MLDKNWGGRTEYRYFLRHRSTGETVELGYIPELTKEIIEEHGITPEKCEEEWEFCCQRSRVYFPPAVPLEPERK